MIVLKPLADAIQANDAIRAVIRGTGMNQDGRTPGIAMPSGSAQGKRILWLTVNQMVA
jgi:acyl transferase domain-containing protein